MSRNGSHLTIEREVHPYGIETLVVTDLLAFADV